MHGRSFVSSTHIAVISYWIVLRRRCGMALMISFYLINYFLIDTNCILEDHVQQTKQPILESKKQVGDLGSGRAPLSIK